MNLVADTEAVRRQVANGSVETLTEAEARPVVERLAAVLREHDRRYYVLDAPVIADPEYDQLLRALQTLEARFPALAAADSPTLRVGGAPLDAFQKVRHPEPLLSLSNAFDAAELRACSVDSQTDSAKSRLHSSSNRKSMGWRWPSRM